MLVGLVLASLGVDGCSVAGMARAVFREPSALQFMTDENERRAPFYLHQGEELFEKAVKQKNGIDKSNDDPFIALYDAKHQVLAALELAPENATVWFGAGKIMARIAALDSEAGSSEEALRLMARACELDLKNLDRFARWAGSANGLGKVQRRVRQALESWKDGVPRVSFDDFLPLFTERGDSSVCVQSSPMDQATPHVSVGGQVATEESSEAKIKAVLASMQVRPVFPTLITTVNVANLFGDGFTDSLADMAVRRYEAFSADMKRKGVTDENDINDKFFGSQASTDGQYLHDDRFWPELYRSPEYVQLLELMRGSLIEHAAKTGYALSASDQKDSELVMWAAVYLGNGGRHGYHVHQNSVSSCVFYPGASTTPITFVDPRGAPPTHDYEQHIGERDFEPTAPFHHNYNFFASAGDLVCFPSWLVHKVPSHFDIPRVAFPANLQMRRAWDAWYRSATLP